MFCAGLWITIAVAAVRAPAADAVGGEHDDSANPIDFLKKRVAEHPTDPTLPTRLALAYLERAKRTADFTLYAQADAACREALKRDPKNVGAMLALGATHLAQHRFTEAAETAEQALAVQADSVDALALRGDARLQTGNYAAAREDYEKLAQTRPDVVAHVRLAHLHWAEADAEGALASFEAAVAAGQEQAAAPVLMAWCFVRFGEFRFRSGEWDEAERLYAIAEELAPAGDDADVLDHLAELHAARGEFEKALAASERAIAASPRPEFEHARGDIYAAMGRPEDAFAAHQKALAEYLRAAEAGHAHYLHHLATLYSDVEAFRDPAEAVRWARRDLQLRKTASTYDALAWALYHQGKFAEAAEAMNRAFQRGNTVDAHVLYHAGLIYSRAINAEKGRAFLRRAARANPKFNEFHFHR